MRIDTTEQLFNMRQIQNRRFMFNPQTGTLILGRQYADGQMKSSHAQEHFESRTLEPFDSFIRGWVGTGKSYKSGIIHFAPNISRNNIQQFENAYSTLEMFIANNANGKTIIRGFGDKWEQPLSGVLNPEYERSGHLSDPAKEKAGNSRDKVKELTDKLEQGLQDLFDSERYAEYLRVMSKFYHYSANNNLLIAMQRPDATFVAGYSDWKKKFHRHVKRNEHGIKILAPCPINRPVEAEKIDPITNKPEIGPDGKPVMVKQEATIAAFRVVTVFDVSQTDGEPLPTLGVNKLTGDVENYDAFFEALERISPVPMGFSDILGNTLGFYSHETEDITIQKGMSQAQTVQVAIHEIAHAKLHAIDKSLPLAARKDKNTREVEAESVAYTVCQHFGIDTSSFSIPYLAGWSSDRSAKELKASMITIRKAAGELITGIEGQYQELLQQREQAEPEQPETMKPDTPEPGTFEIYQVKDGPENHYRRFTNLETLAREGDKVDAANYNRVYSASLKPGMTLEGIFRRFNTDRPEDFTGHSLSVSDVVVLHQNGRDTAHFVDSRGFADVPQFLEQINHLKSAEMGVEQNYNMIDGQINNLSPKIEDNTFSILRLIDNEENDERREMSYAYLKSTGKEVDATHYHSLYVEPIKNGDTVDNLLDRFCFTQLPADYKGPQVTPSDVIVIKQNGDLCAYYVDDENFVELPNFMEKEIDRIKSPIDENRNTNDINGDFPPVLLPYLEKEGPFILDPNKEPVVNITWSENSKIPESGVSMPLHVADALIRDLDAERSGHSDKTDFTITFKLAGEIDTYNGSLELGDGQGLIEHIRDYAEYCLHNEGWQNYIRSQGPEAQAEENANLHFVADTIVPYLETHNRLSALEAQAREHVAALRENPALDLLHDGGTQARDATMEYVDVARAELNTITRPDDCVELAYLREVEDGKELAAFAREEKVKEQAQQPEPEPQPEPQESALPVTDTIEAKFERGEITSLFDLMQRDEKPSVKEQIKAAKREQKAPDKAAPTKPKKEMEL